MWCSFVFNSFSINFKNQCIGDNKSESGPEPPGRSNKNKNRKGNASKGLGNESSRHPRESQDNNSSQENWTSLQDSV